MHPALRNLEVIHMICSYTKHETLPALACTCRAFEHPALNVLWRNLQSVDTLIECMPDDLFDFEQGDVVLQKPPDDKTWDTLCRYTSRVHSIRQTYYQLVPTEALSLILLSCPLAPASLFPNLRNLIWKTDGTRSAADFLRMALVPTLLVLEVNVSVSTSPAFLSVLSSFGTSCPRLQSITLKYHPVLDDQSIRKILPFIVKPISKLHQLRVLNIWELGDQDIKHIMELQALQSLTLSLGVSSTWKKRSHLQLPGFRDLHSLLLSIDNFDYACNFFAALEVVRSREITISFYPQSPARASTILSHFFVILQERCDCNKLECFSLVGYSRIPLTVASDVFTSLHAFRNLTQLNIQRGCNISMSDEGLCQLVRAWPKLQILQISSYVAIDTTTVPTFHGLIGLLRLCPALISLALVIDTTKLDNIDLMSPSGGSLNTCLNHLTLGNSLIDSPANVALILSGLFPHLEQVDLDCWEHIPVNNLPQKIPAMEQWASVNDILRGSSVVRKWCVEA
ncbi:hypothetical protein BDR04DRAFT_1229255 [Suillus decipiens]|nr:hypothetical protein BDR04DRAFT_1229255 [Suillus decipiens]